MESPHRTKSTWLPWQRVLPLTAHTLHGYFFWGEGEHCWNVCEASGSGGSSIACSTLSSTTDLAFDDENSSCAWFNSLTQDLEDFQQKREKSGSQFTSPCHTTFLKPVSLPTHPLSLRSLESWPQHRLPLRKILIHFQKDAQFSLA